MNAHRLAAAALAFGFTLPALAQEKKPEAPQEKQGEKKDEKNEDPDVQAQKKLDEQKLSLNFEDTPAAEVFDFLRDITGLNIVVATDALNEKRITLKLKEVSVATALKLILAVGDDVKHEVWRGVVFVSRKDEKPEPKASAKLSDAAKGATKVSLNFVDTPLADVVDFLAELTALNFAIDAKVKKEQKVTLRAKDLPLSAIVDLLCRAHGLRLDVVDKVNVLKPQKKD